ncbi:MAG: helix-turn-helix domain-containing protein [Gammaproteobacteria bacterium]|nr:helix-turn-helix domain-containing protein [Gammaproteobacteria bacterium]
MKKIIIGIMPQDRIRARMLAIAKGEYKPKRGEPKVWFTSMKSLAEVLSDKNRALLQTIAELEPDSLQELADATGRQTSNLSRTLKTLESYGFVELKKIDKTVKPIVKATEFEIRAA